MVNGLVRVEPNLPRMFGGSFRQIGSVLLLVKPTFSKVLLVLRGIARAVFRASERCPGCGGPSFDAFWEAPRKLGWVEGTTVVIDHKEARSGLDEFPILAAISYHPNPI